MLKLIVLFDPSLLHISCPDLINSADPAYLPTPLFVSQVLLSTFPPPLAINIEFYGILLISVDLF